MHSIGLSTFKTEEAFSLLRLLYSIPNNPRYMTDSSLPASKHLLFVSPACPFCHRVLIGLQLTRQTDHFSYLWVDDVKREKGWEILSTDTRYAGKFMRDIYAELAPDEIHRPAVPLLIDPQAQHIVTTSSLEMLRQITTGFDSTHEIPITLAPNDLLPEIDELNHWLQDHINRAVYDVMSAQEQQDYENKVHQLFQDLDLMEQRLKQQTYLFGEQLTESDILLFTTLIRFDVVYNPLFKCSIKRIIDYPNLAAYRRRLLEIEDIATTVNLTSIKTHYYKSLIHIEDRAITLNPSGIVPV